MKIRSVSRTPFLTKKERFGGISQTSQGSETRDYPGFAGTTLKDDTQLMSFLLATLPEGHQLEEITGFYESAFGEDMRVQPSYRTDGDTKPLPAFRTFEEYGPPTAKNERGDLVAQWGVEIDRTFGVKKEQVSLTLSSNVLETLRARAKDRKTSLSGIIDESLSLSLSSEDSWFRDQTARFVTRMESLIEEYRAVANKDLVLSAHRYTSPSNQVERLK